MDPFLDTDKFHILRTLEEIAAYMRVSRGTIGRWIKKHGFPAVKTPGGLTVTSYFLIDAWLMARKRALDERKRAKRNDQA